MQSRGYKDLIVWQKAIKLATLTYQLVKDFPKEELFGLTSQIKRAVTSVPANIAEGSGRKTEKDFKHFLAMAYGSSLELETHLLLGKQFGFGKSSHYVKAEEMPTEVQKMLYKMKQDA